MTRLLISTGFLALPLFALLILKPPVSIKTHTMTVECKTARACYSVKPDCLIDLTDGQINVTHLGHAQPATATGCVRCADGIHPLCR